MRIRFSRLDKCITVAQKVHREHCLRIYGFSPREENSSESLGGRLNTWKRIVFVIKNTFCDLQSLSLNKKSKNKGAPKGLIFAKCNEDQIRVSLSGAPFEAIRVMRNLP